MKLSIIKQNWIEANGINHEYLVIVDGKAQLHGSKEQVEGFMKGLYGN